LKFVEYPLCDIILQPIQKDEPKEAMEKELTDRAAAIHDRLTQLRDSL
jgi:hypothetical protein